MGHLQHLENNKISIQIYKVIQHFTGWTWKKLRVIIVGWQAKRRQGDMDHLQCLENNKISVQIYKYNILLDEPPCDIDIFSCAKISSILSESV
jgi:hypothetical protein